MAQFYQILSPEDKSGGEITQFYPAVDETQTVQYVIAPETHANQFQAQQVVVSDQVMVVDGQPQQVIIDQSAVAYQSSYIIQENSLNFQSGRQVYYMANTQPANIVVEQQQSQTQPQIIQQTQEQQQVQVQIQPQQQSSPQAQQQPVVLNHLIQNKTGQGGIRQKQQSTVVRPQQGGQSPVLAQNFLVQQLKKSPSPGLIKQQTMSEQESEIEEYVTLADGTMVTVQQYKKLMAQQQQLQRQQRTPVPERNDTTGLVGGMPQQPPIRRPRNVTPRPRGRGRVLPNPSYPRAMAPIRQPLRRPQNESDEHFEQQVPSVSSNPFQQQQQQLLRPINKNNSYMIHPPRPGNQNKQTAYRPLPPILHSTQIQQILESTPLSDEYSDSIRMLVLLENGEQRLITFTLPKEPCSIHEILEQVNVPFTSETKIQVTEANASGLNYVVAVGNVPGFFADNSQNEETPQQPTTTAAASTTTITATPTSTTPGSKEKSYQLSIVENEDEQQKTPSPEIPKVIPGKLALCTHCGYLSEHFNRCTRCLRKLPENVKIVPSQQGNIASGKKIDRPLSSTERKLVLNKTTGLGTPKLNLLQKKKAACSSTNKSKLNEFETVVVSSDDEDDDSKKSPVKNVNEELIEKLGGAVTLSPISKEPSILDIQKTSLIVRSPEKIPSEQVLSTSIQCRTVRIGSYRFIPPENIRIDSTGLYLKVPHPKQEDTIKFIKINNSDIVKLLISFQKALIVMFFYVVPSVGATIRKALDMAQGAENYFDPLSEMEESHRRITLLPEVITEESKNILLKIYNKSMFEEITYKEANDILIKTCPKELTKNVFNNSIYSQNEVKMLLIYPPEGRGRISINTEDYVCLAQEQFLNDVIIDFYLTYLFHNLPDDKRQKVHIFSTFFYKRLTTKPAKTTRKSQTAEPDSNLSAAEKRHLRVKTWTKNVNIFEKDFIIVPINENCHWFLAIICFPGINGTQTMQGQPIKIETKERKKKKNNPNPEENTTAGPAKDPIESIVCDDGEVSDKDEAEGDDSELDSDDSDEIPVYDSNKKPAIKQPCILIFDSLAGASRSRVVATLRDYLTCEYKTKMNKEKIFTKDVIKGACPKVPQQTNYTDCGLYLLQYVEQFFKDPIKDYYIPIYQLKTWFEEPVVTRKREEISDLIKSLMKEYGKDLSLVPDVTFPSLDDRRNTIKDNFSEEEMEDEDDEDFVPSPGSNKSSDSDTNNSNKPLSENGNSKSSDLSVSDTNILTPTISEFPKQTSNKDTLSYLKAKRIVRHKNNNPDEQPDAKKIKSDNSP